MAIFATDIIQEVREKTNRPLNNFPTDTELFKFISRAQQKISEEVNFVAPNFNLEQYSFKRSSGQRFYDLPADYGGYLSRAQDISINPPRNLELTSFRNLQQIDGGDPEQVAIRGGNQLAIGPTPTTNDSSDTVRLDYTRSPENVFAGNLASAGTGFVQFDSGPSAGVIHRYDSAYVNSEIFIRGSSVFGERKKISKFTASNLVAEVENDFGTTPSKTASYEIILDVPNNKASREALVSHAAKSTMRMDEMPDNVDVRDFNNAMSDLKSVLTTEGFHG